MIQSESDNPILSKNQDQSTKEQVLYGETPFSSPQLNEKWPQIIEVLHESYPRDYNALKYLSFELNENQIILHVKSEHIKKSVEQRLLILTQEAQKILDNRNIRIGFELKKQEEKAPSLYLIKDKYKYYVEKNKKIEELVEKLGLDL